MNRRIINTICLLLLFTIASCSSSNQTQADREASDAVNLALSSSLTIQTSEAPKNVILLIPDGFGPASLTAAREYHGLPLNLDSIISGVVKTRATDSPITDSAASATAYATGHRTYNGAIAVDVNKRPLATILEGARAKGMKTGLVATSRITHATPACFASHVPARSMEEEIAPQILEHKVDVIFGGGIEFFQPADDGGRRKDNRDLIAEAKKSGYQFVTNEKEMSELASGSALGLFSNSHMAYEIDRERTEQPSLREMLLKAIELLDGTDEGFFLMVEASRIDHAGHANDIAAHLGDIFAFDEAVGAAKKFADANGETLLVSVADHETGGLSVGRKVGKVDHYNWLPDEIKKITASVAFINAEGGRTSNPDSVWLAETGISLTEEEQKRIDDMVGSGNRYGVGNLLGAIIGERTLTGWTTNGHTGVDVNLASFGVGASKFSGVLRNDDIGRFLAQAMDLDLKTMTEEMNK